MYTDSPRIPSSICASIFFDIYERAELDQVVAHCDFSLPIIELGASIGVGTMQILKQTKQTVISVEADSEIAEMLKANVEQNGLNRENFTALTAIVNYSDKEQITWQMGDDSLRGRVEVGLPEKTSSVNCITLAQLLDQNNIDRYDLVVDIEGAEAALFLNEHQALEKCRLIMAEIDGGLYADEFHNIRQLVDVLGDYGFTVIHGHGNRFTFRNSNLP